MERFNEPSVVVVVVFNKPLKQIFFVSFLDFFVRFLFNNKKQVFAVNVFFFFFSIIHTNLIEFEFIRFIRSSLLYTLTGPTMNVHFAVVSFARFLKL